MNEKTLKIQKATAQNVAPYGELLDATGKEPAFDSEIFSFWNDLSLGTIGESVSFGMVYTKPGDLVATNLERHLNTTETLVPLDRDAVFVLAEPTTGEWPDLDNAAAFLVPTGSAITLKKGTWHYVPLLPNREEGRTLVVFRQGTPAEDLEVRQLADEKGITIRLVD